MPQFWKPADKSKGSSYHTVKHDNQNLIPATEEEIRSSNLTACGNCVRFHGLVPLE